METTSYDEPVRIDWLARRGVVRDFFPEADDVSKHGVYEIRSHAGFGSKTLGSGPTRESAWIDAYARLAGEARS